ncbi:uracil-DNA glycosylase-like protein [Mycena pura]|uniref:Uracil-DNA glycosylase n=1 Tax=Mycena pura TaxID=153505 RepID=A0AAD6VTY8_9AGAR|nr:uracil-DNA glycosylase-like protein [Mycena pura]
MSTTTASDTVYLEDIKNTRKDEKETVYLEDIQTSYKKEKPIGTGTAPLAVATDTGKRQRTLFDMKFASDGPTAAKRQKLATGPSPAARFTATGPPRAFTKGQRLNSIPFSLSTFISGLPDDETRSLLALECDVMGKSWMKVLADELKKPYFLALKRFLYAEGVRGALDPAPQRVYPPPKNIYTWSDTPLGKVKVVILGQDPYPGKGQAHGLSFSVPAGIAVPASLQNIYTELRNEYPSFTPPKHGNLASWAEQGVLMLNAVLTVRANAPDSHAGRGWETFTERVMQVVDAYGGANLARPGETAQGVGRGVVVLAWGAKAAQRVKTLDATKHLILRSAHPSPRSADNGFFGNGHFCKANEWLEVRYGAGGGVDWCKI